MQSLDVEAANEICWNVAYKVHQRIPQASLDDISQEIWLWIVEHQAEVLSWDEDDRVRYLYHRAFRAGFAYARRERAKVVGYEPQDEYFYRVGTLRKILPLFYGEAWDEIILPDRDVVLDLERALVCLDLATAALLREVFGEDDAEARTKALALAWECTEEAAQKRVSRALKKLQEALGGPDPYYEGPGAREALSNAHAAAITRRSYGAD